jgi:hypothetical protein
LATGRDLDDSEAGFDSQKRREMGFVAGSISVETEESSKHLKMRKAKGPEDGRDSCCMS